MAFLHTVISEEESLVIDCQQYCLEHLVSRLYESESDGHDAAHLPVEMTAPQRGAQEAAAKPAFADKGRFLP